MFEAFIYFLGLFLIIYLFAEWAKRSDLKTPPVEKKKEPHHGTSIYSSRGSVRRSLCHTTCESHREDVLETLSTIPKEKE